MGDEDTQKTEHFIDAYKKWLDADFRNCEARRAHLRAYHDYKEGKVMREEVAELKATKNTKTAQEYAAWCVFRDAYLDLPLGLIESGEPRHALARRLSGGDRIKYTKNGRMDPETPPDPVICGNEKND